MKFTLASTFLLSIATVAMAADKSFVVIKCEDSQQHSLCKAALESNPTTSNLSLGKESSRLKEAVLLADGNADEENCAVIINNLLALEECSKCKPAVKDTRPICRKVPKFGM